MIKTINNTNFYSLKELINLIYQIN